MLQAHVREHRTQRRAALPHLAHPAEEALAPPVREQSALDELWLLRPLRPLWFLAQHKLQNGRVAKHLGVPHLHHHARLAVVLEREPHQPVQRLAVAAARLHHSPLAVLLLRQLQRQLQRKLDTLVHQHLLGHRLQVLHRIIFHIFYLISSYICHFICCSCCSLPKRWKEKKSSFDDDDDDDDDDDEKTKREEMK